MPERQMGTAGRAFLQIDSTCGQVKAASSGYNGGNRGGLAACAAHRCSVKRFGHGRGYRLDSDHVCRTPDERAKQASPVVAYHSNVMPMSASFEFRCGSFGVRFDVLPRRLTEARCVIH
jgi:hypothetical protein